MRSGLEASALPFDKVAALLPRDVTHIALDERANEYIAFKRDGTLHARYPADQPHVHALQLRNNAGTCTNLSTAEVQTRRCFFDSIYQPQAQHCIVYLVPGWNKIVEYAQKNWGKGSYNLATNPPEVRVDTFLHGRLMLIVCMLLLIVLWFPSSGLHKWKSWTELHRWAYLHLNSSPRLTSFFQVLPSVKRTMPLSKVVSKGPMVVLKLK